MMHHNKPCPRKIFLWKKANFQVIREEFHAFSDNFTATYNVNSNINSLWSSFKLKCLELLNKWVPSKNASTRFHQPWINTTLKRLCRHKQRYYNIACRSHLEDDWLRFKNFKKYTQQECKKAYNEYLRYSSSVMSCVLASNSRGAHELLYCNTRVS